jgi:hypothetical protein
MPTKTKTQQTATREPSATPLLLTQEEAAAIVGIPYSTMRKAFLGEGKRPSYIKNPPPHTYFGRSPRIYADSLIRWAMTLGV